MQANQAAHLFTFIFCPPGCSPEGDLRCLLGLAGQYKPQAHRAGSNPPETGTAFQPYEFVTEPQVLNPLRPCSPRTVELTFTSFNQQSCIHSHSEVITVPPFSQVSRSPYLMLPSWELQGGDQPPLLPIGVGVPDWGLAPGPYLILWPILVSWPILPVNSVGAWPSREWEWRSEREPGIPSDGAPPCSSQGSSAPTRPSHQSGGSRGGRGWNLTGASRNVAESSTREKKPHIGELENSGLLCQ